MNHDGMILLRKPEGVTSFRALNILKKKLKTKKIGHTGTLDKFATGLLVILTGKMTKFAPYITGMDKTYIATFRFGETTDTLDPEGDIISTNKIIPTLESIENCIKNNFIGEIEQIPPDFSAIHLGGQRAYQLKLKGEEVKIPPRKIKIYKFNITDWNGIDLTAEISCSKGTYIRSIARDLGKLCNSCAYVTTLKRTTVGPFDVKDSIDGENFTIENLIQPYDLLVSLNRNISFITEAGKNEIKQGKSFKQNFYEKNSTIYTCGEVALFTKQKEFVAMIEVNNDICKYLFVSSI